MTGGTQLDKARTIARWLHNRLDAVDPETAAKIASAAHAAGETWLAPVRDTHTGPWLTRREVAELGGVSPAAVSMWASRGIDRAGRTIKLTRYPQGYELQEAMDFIALLRTPQPREATP